MALTDNAWYVDFGDGSTTGYYGVTQWATGTVKAAGAIVRQKTAPAVGSERCFICIVAGTTHATTEPTWTVTRGAKVTDNTVTWQECTGIAAINGDVTNTPTWTTIKGTAITLGQVIKRDNAASFQICTTAGTAGGGAEPAFSNTAGTTTADNTVTWTSLGVVGNFTGWQAPHARLSNATAATWGQAGNSWYVASESAETKTSAATTITLPVSATLVNRVLCVAKSPVPPTATTTGATITTVTSGTITFGSGAAVNMCDGISFVSAGAIIVASGSSNYFRMVNCAFTVAGGQKLTAPNTNVVGSNVKFENCTFTFPSSTTTGISAGTNCSGQVIIKGGTMSFGATKPTTLFTNFPSLQLVEGLDLSAVPSGSTLALANADQSTLMVIKDCKIAAGVTVASISSSPQSRISLVRCDSGTAAYRHELYDLSGAQTIETTIVRTGGATDGVTPISWKIVTNSTCVWSAPFEASPIRIWNDTTGAAKTVTIYGIWGGGAVPNNDDIWMDAEYLGGASDVIGTIVNGTKASHLATGAAQSSDTSTWGGSTTKFKMTASFTPREKGYLYLYIRAGATSSTFYVDPKPVIT